VLGRWGESGTNYRGPVIRKGDRGSTMSHMFLTFSVVSLFCRLYNLTLPDQAQVILQLRVSVFDLMWRFLAGPPLLWGPNILSSAPKPTLGGPDGDGKLNCCCQKYLTYVHEFWLGNFIPGFINKFGWYWMCKSNEKLVMWLELESLTCSNSIDKCFSTNLNSDSKFPCCLLRTVDPCAFTSWPIWKASLHLKIRQGWMIRVTLRFI
jgi:hypothetical protein